MIITTSEGEPIRVLETTENYALVAPIDGCQDYWVCKEEVDFIADPAPAKEDEEKK
ncbi:MAG: hypothetical protein V7K32_10035 [Nostoc sp.]|uniref:hypothetical protein n=1 Tax=Nostoc sp. TaxID=1180 RepID=UPI002FFA7E1B